MEKPFFYNNKISQENKEKKLPTKNFNLNKKNTVDINILLNRVKSEKKNIKRKNFYLVTFSFFLVGIFGILIF